MNVLITGASRGIGLEMVKYSVRQGWRVFACCRDPHSPEKLFEVAKMSGKLVSVHILDVSDVAQIQALSFELRNESIDILINNAGRYGSMHHRFGNVDSMDWIETFKVNTIAPLKMAEAFHSNLLKGKRKLIVNLSSKMGSIDDNTSGGSYIYRSSKAALNAVLKSLAIDLAKDGITCINLHPGWVKTEMGGPNAEISTRESVDKMFNIIKGAERSSSGLFYDIDGSIIPW